MAARNMVGKAKPGMRKAKVQPHSGDEKQLQRMAALLSAHPDMDLPEALEAIGVEDLKAQRRLRKQFEARREELVGAADSRRGGRDDAPQALAQPAKAAALQAPKEPRVASEPVGMAGRDAPEARRSTASEPSRAAEPATARPAAPASTAFAMPAMVAPPCATGAFPAERAMLPPREMLAGGLQALTVGLRMQTALVEAWMRLPPVSFALAQQAAAYNAWLGLAAASLPKGK